jgi:hypothetical protein
MSKLNELRRAWALARTAGNEAAMIDIEAEAKRIKRVWDTDRNTSGTHKCGRCAGTGRFITGSLNGKPTGPGGICFRCNGKGKHTRKDRRRNDYHDTHMIVRM